MCPGITTRALSDCPRDTTAFPGTDAITLADSGLFRALISNSYNYLHDVEGAEIRGNTGKTGQARVEKCPHSLLVERFSRVSGGSRLTEVLSGCSR
jgi:hypothetical protein